MAHGPREKKHLKKTSLESEISDGHNLSKKWGFVLFYDFFMNLLTPCVPFQVFSFFLFSGTHQWMGMYEVRYFFPCHCFNLMTSVQPSSTTKFKKLPNFFSPFFWLFSLNCFRSIYKRRNTELKT